MAGCRNTSLPHSPNWKWMENDRSATQQVLGTIVPRFFVLLRIRYNVIEWNASLVCPWNWSIKTSLSIECSPFSIRFFHLLSHECSHAYSHHGILETLEHFKCVANRFVTLQTCNHIHYAVHKMLMSMHVNCLIDICYIFTLQKLTLIRLNILKEHMINFDIID